MSHFVVGIDLGPDLLVLEAVLLDVGPELLGELRAGERGRTNNRGERGVGSDRFHECSVRFTSGFFCHIDFLFECLRVKATPL